MVKVSTAEQIFNTITKWQFHFDISGLVRPDLYDGVIPGGSVVWINHLMYRIDNNGQNSVTTQISHVLQSISWIHLG